MCFFKLFDVFWNKIDIIAAQSFGQFFWFIPIINNYTFQRWSSKMEPCSVGELKNDCHKAILLAFWIFKTYQAKREICCGWDYGNQITWKLYVCITIKCTIVIHILISLDKTVVIFTRDTMQLWGKVCTLNQCNFHTTTNIFHLYQDNNCVPLVTQKLNNNKTFTPYTVHCPQNWKR